MTRPDLVVPRPTGPGEFAHAMQCPLDKTALVMSERQGIEIDYCPTCRGVWLDRGELDKIIERSLADNEPAPSAHDARKASASPLEHSSSRREYEEEDRYRHGGYRKGRKRSFLSGLFD